MTVDLCNHVTHWRVNAECRLCFTLTRDIFPCFQKQKVGWVMFPKLPPRLKASSRKKTELTSPWWTCVGPSCPPARPDLDVDRRRRPKQTVPRQSPNELRTRRLGSLSVQSLLWDSSGLSRKTNRSVSEPHKPSITAWCDQWEASYQ